MTLIGIWLIACLIPQLVSTANQSAKPQSSPVLSCSACGVPGVPGVPGLNGKDGAIGPVGAAGKMGPKGPAGPKGEQGTVGAPGKMGRKGPAGPKGEHGPVGAPGKMGPMGSQGVKGEQGLSGAVPEKNWKQCVWKKLNDGRDYGLIKDCVFVKKDQATALRVEYDGDLRVGYCEHCCKRWYFTFNGAECSNPITIEGIEVIYKNHGKTDTNVHKHSQIGGYCEGIGKGTVRVGLAVGDCPGYKSGSDAYTGYNSVARIIIEEVSKPQ